MSDLPVVAALDAPAARSLTDEVKADAAALWQKLLTLYEGGAHRALGYSSWGAYFEAEFGQSGRHGYRLLEAARAVGSLPSDQMVTESQARELARVPEPERASTWQQANERAEAEQRPVTAADVRVVATLAAAPVIATAPDLPPDTFRTIVADPPWPYGNTATRGSAEDHYPTMSMDELAALDVAGLADDSAHLYLWVTNGFLREGFDLIDAWGFVYKACLTWVKPQMGLGNYFRGATEHVLFAVRGRLPTLSRSTVNWFEARRGRHSAKPDTFYDLVETSSPGPYLELFARRQRLGWSSWGNEALEHVAVEAVA